MPKNKLLALFIVLILIFSGLVLYRIKTSDKPLQETDNTPPVANEIDNSNNKYINRVFGVSFSYPKGWEAPHINETEDGFTFEIGTDKVYPPETDPLERQYQKFNSYYITVSYTKKPLNQANEGYLQEQPWLADYLELADLNPGDKSSTMRSELTKIRDIQIGSFTGFEMTSTLSASAQTQMYYVREVFLVNSDYDVVRIAGSPNNVEVSDFSNWKEDYIRIDEENYDNFLLLADSLELNN